MSLFLDASAMVAIMTDEPDAFDLERRFGLDHDRLCSAISLWETARALAKKRVATMPSVQADIEAFRARFAVRVVLIGEAEAVAAMAVHGRYGKGSGHPARLNMGDCFAYACAKANNARLLYKGDDFAQTDLAWSAAA